MAQTKGQTKVEISNNIKTTYHRESAFSGFLKWWVKDRVDIIGSDLIIETQVEIENIYLNGKKLINKR